MLNHAVDMRTIDVLQALCQFDDGFLFVSDDHDLMIKFPILGSDPEHYFEEFDIKQEDGFNIINLSKQATNIMKFMVN